MARVAVQRFGDGVLVREGARALLVRGVTVADGYVLSWEGQAYRLTRPLPPTVESTALATGPGHGARDTLTAPMPGKIIKVHVAEGERVGANQPLLVLEAMKMEHTIAAPHAGCKGGAHAAASKSSRSTPSLTWSPGAK